MNRYRYLDVLRGFAILGIFPANLPLFATPIMHSQRTTNDFTDMLGHYAMEVFIEHKFISLFCVLFGAGIFLFRQRAESRGERTLRLMLRRLGGLFLFGLLHIVLLWFGDILWYYSVLGLLAALCFRWPIKRLLAVAMVLLAVAPALMVIESFVIQPEPYPKPTAEEIAAQVALVHAPLNEFVSNLEFGTAAFETKLYHEADYVRTMIYRMFITSLHAPMMAIFMGGRILGLMLIGMALAKSGWFLEPAKHRSRFRRMALVGLSLGFPLQLGAVLLPLAFDSPVAAFVEHLSFYLATYTLAAGYAGAIGLLCSHARFTAHLRPLEAAGRTALTNYISQSVIAVALFYNYGLGLYGSLNRGQLWFIVFAVWGVQLFISSMWLKRFDQGPLEWVLRRMTHGGRVRALSSGQSRDIGYGALRE